MFTPRAAWTDAPEQLRAAVADALGCAITGHTDLQGGMSPGPAAALRLTDGRTVFVKAMSAEVRAHNHLLVGRESVVLDLLPESVPAPRRLATVESGAWIALVTTWAAGAAGELWSDASIDAVVAACRTTSGHRAPEGLRPVVERIYDFDGWERVVAAGPADEWEAAYARRAADLAVGWARWTAGDALVHRDIRADNTAVDTATGSATLLDWAYAAAGAPWLDLAQLAADIVATGHMLGGQVAADRAYRLIQTLPPEAARYVVALTGMWRIRAATPQHSVLPTISAWRRERVRALRPLVTRLITDRVGAA
ncbi:phosphotransferase [Catellatospora sp. KI3]|uniref:phosphotransferase n=1 Tax=Catellatospora sp. KI3 TaxID=3041620 RepID=UPI0024824247|nr:phosphotransferase [Catellatospora sp. KI3]MDI1463538.1 phosphotransferase [Catellatospora sp. KI3]